MEHKTMETSRALMPAQLVAPTEQGISSRVLVKTSGGNVTLFAFDKGQALSEHSAPFDALVTILEGSLAFTIADRKVEAPEGSITLLPANIPHALEALQPTRMLLVMLREISAQK